MYSMVIITDPDDPRLRGVASPVSPDDKDVRGLARDLIAAARRSAEPAVGLAAPQVGVPARVIAVKRSDRGGTWTALINPEIMEESREGLYEHEGCLSVPGRRFLIRRPRSITVYGYSEKGKRVRERVHGEIARIYLHEIDHLFGRLLLDYA